MPEMNPGHSPGGSSPVGSKYSCLHFTQHCGRNLGCTSKKNFRLWFVWLQILNLAKRKQRCFWITFTSGFFLAWSSFKLGTTFLHRDFWRSSWTLALISVSESDLFSVQCCLRPKDHELCPCPMCTDVPSGYLWLYDALLSMRYSLLWNSF